MKLKTSVPAWRADLVLVAITIIWGATFVLIKEALANVSTMLFLALRFSLGTAALAIAFRGLWGRGRSNTRAPAGESALELAAPRSAVAGGVVTGLFLFAGLLLQTVGLRYTTASKSAFITGLSVVLVPLFGAVVRRKAPHPEEALGVAIATVGLALMTLRGESLRMGRGDLLTLASTAAFAGYILAVGRYAPKIGFAALSLGQAATAAALSLATFWWVETPTISWRPSVIVALGVTGVLSTALASCLQAWAQQFTTPTRTALVFALEPVFAWITSYLVMREILSFQASVGAVFILSGILVVELKPLSNRLVVR